MLAATPAGVGLAAKQLCSLVYVSGMDPEMARSMYVDDLVSPLDLVLSVTYDDAEQHVEAGALGVWTATVQMRDGVGCTLTTALDGDLREPVELPGIEDEPLPTMSAEDVAAVFGAEALDAALDAAFDPAHRTMAIVVLHEGRLVTEGYAAGVDSGTPLPGWSLAKSVTATLVGMLVGQGQLDVHEAGVVEEWADDADRGGAVTIDHLLRMTSGLDVVEGQSGADPNSRMIGVEPEAAAFAAGGGLRSRPGDDWAYMSGNTVLVSREIAEVTGGTLESSQQFIRRELLAPLGASSFVVEPDAAGTFVGSTYMLASARDWAKLGQLYLNDGVWDGERLLPEGWRDYVTTHAPQSGESRYGAGFWLWRDTSETNLPPDTFLGIGFQGQFIFVIPS